MNKQTNNPRKRVTNFSERHWLTIKLFKITEIVLVAALAGAATAFGTVWASGWQTQHNMETPRVWQAKTTSTHISV